MDAKTKEEAVSIINALKVNRPELGKYTGVGLYRLFRLVAMEDILGQGASAISYYAGKKLGSELGITSIEEFIDLCTEMKVGIIKAPKVEDDFIHIDVYECVTCDGMEPVGRTLCSFEGGLMAGAIESVTGKRASAKEVSCIGGFGDETCGFDIKIKEK